MLAAFLVSALMAAALGGLAIGAAVVARHRAQSAADLAALAAATELPAGPAVACGRASAVAAGTGAALRGCVVIDLDVVVTVAVRAGGPFNGEAQAGARAGPVR